MFSFFVAIGGFSSLLQYVTVNSAAALGFVEIYEGFKPVTAVSTARRANH